MSFRHMRKGTLTLGYNVSHMIGRVHEHGDANHLRQKRNEDMYDVFRYSQ